MKKPEIAERGSYIVDGCRPTCVYGVNLPLAAKDPMPPAGCHGRRLSDCHQIGAEAPGFRGKCAIDTITTPPELYYYPRRGKLIVNCQYC